MVGSVVHLYNYNMVGRQFRVKLGCVGWPIGRFVLVPVVCGSVNMPAFPAHHSITFLYRGTEQRA